MRLRDPRSPAPEISLRLDGERLPARLGETVAAALVAAGRLVFRRTATGAPRGPHCGMGACFDCLVTVDGRPGQRACMTLVADGMSVGTAPMPVPPPPMPYPPDPLPERVLTPAVLVVGGGPAGLSAAVAAAEAGADVLLLDERASLGGQYFKPAAARDGRSRRGDRLRARAAAVPTLQAMAWGAFPGPEIAAVSAEARLLLRPRILILAPGAHEAPVPLPGWTLPGCLTTGALQGLVRTHRVLPGPRVAIAGNGPLNLQVAVEVLRAGGQVAAVVEAAARPTGLAQGWGMAMASPALAFDGLRLLARLRAAGVPVLWETRPIRVLGTERAEGLMIDGPGGTRAIAADAVALNWGFQAETGLARLLEVPHRVVAGRLETTTGAEGRTTVPNVFVVGDGARPGGAIVAQHRGRAAGRAAARDLGLAARGSGDAGIRRAERFQGALWDAFAAAPPDPADLPDDATVCRCEEVTAGDLRRARTEGAGSLAALKRATRAGMGPCAGRFCAAAVARLCGAADEAGFAAPRVPLRPVPAGAVLADHDELREAVVLLPVPTRWITAPSPAAPSPATPFPATPPLATRTAADAPSADTSAAFPAEAAVVVIGGGIVGLATALYLAREGVDVLVLDRGEPGMAASTANAGSLHIQLVPYVYAEGGGPMADALPLGPRGVALWRDLARDANEDLGLRTEGGLILAETEAELALLRAKAAFERSRGIPSEVVDAADLRRIAPGLEGGFAGAAFCPDEGQGDPLRGTMALLTLARRAGARLAPRVEVTGLEPDGAGWRVRTAAGSIRAGRVVNAAGAQAGRVGGLAGVTVPMHALVQQVIATEAAPPMLRQLVAWTGRHLSLKQGDGGHILVGGGWPGRHDGNGATHVRRESFEGNLALACRALPGLRGVRVLRAWTGLAPHLDRAPVISATPGRPGLWHGVTGNGYTLGPVVGRMLADAVLADAALGRDALPEVFGIERR